MQEDFNREEAFHSAPDCGLTRIEYYAAAALCLIPKRGGDGYPRTAQAIAEDAFMIAEAMCNQAYARIGA